MARARLVGRPSQLVWVAAVLLAAAPATAQPQAPRQDSAFVAIGMPFTGPYDAHDFADPPTHHPEADWADWMSDLIAPDAAVYAEFGPASGEIDLLVTRAVPFASCADGVDGEPGLVTVEVSVDGVVMGSVEPVIITDIPPELVGDAPVAIDNGAYLGRTPASGVTSSTCGEADFLPHVHLNVIPGATHACYRTDNQLPGVQRGDVIGVFGDAYATARRQPCEALPDRGPVTSGRLAGPTREETAAAIAAAGFPAERGWHEVVVVDRELGLPLALAAGARQAGGPVLLVPRDAAAISPAVTDVVEALDPDFVTGLGVPLEVAEAVADGRELGGLFGSGLSAYDFAAILVTDYGEPAPTVYLSETQRLADGLAGGPLDGPIALVPADGPVPQVMLDAIAAYDPAEVVALGGSGAISDAVLQQAAGGRPTRRVAGATRFETAAAIAREGFVTAGTVLLSRADIAPDAVVAGTLGQPILLVESCRGDGSVPPIHPATAGELQRLQPDRVVALGGTAAVCDEVLAAAAAFAR